MTPEETLVKIETLISRLERLVVADEKKWEKLDLLAALASAHADRQLLVLNRIEKNTDSNSRVSEQLTFLRQKLSESVDQREYIRAGLDQLRTDLATHFAVANTKLDGVDKDLDHLRENSGKFALLSPDDIRKEAEQRGEAIKIKASAEAEAIKTTAEAEAKAIEQGTWVSRVLVVVFKGSVGGQVTAVLLALIAAAALVLGGAQTLKSLFPGWFAHPAPPAAAKPADKGATHADDSQAKP